MYYRRIIVLRRGDGVLNRETAAAPMWWDRELVSHASHLKRQNVSAILVVDGNSLWLGSTLGLPYAVLHNPSLAFAES